MFFSIARAKPILSAPLLGVAVLSFNAVLGGDIKLGIFLSVLAIMVDCLSKLGLELRNDRKAYRDCFVLFNWRIGWWKSLPRVVGVTLKYFSYLSSDNSTLDGATIWNKGSQRHEELVVMLSLEHSNTGLIIKRFELSDVNQAIDIAHDIAKFFDVSVHPFLPPS